MLMSGPATTLSKLSLSWIAVLLISFEAALQALSLSQTESLYGASPEHSDDPNATNQTGNKSSPPKRRRLRSCRGRFNRSQASSTPMSRAWFKGCKFLFIQSSQAFQSVTVLQSLRFVPCTRFYFYHCPYCPCQTTQLSPWSSNSHPSLHDMSLGFHLHVASTVCCAGC